MNVTARTIDEVTDRALAAAVFPTMNGDGIVEFEAESANDFGWKDCHRHSSYVSGDISRDAVHVQHRFKVDEHRIYAWLSLAYSANLALFRLENGQLTATATSAQFNTWGMSSKERWRYARLGDADVIFIHADARDSLVVDLHVPAGRVRSSSVWEASVSRGASDFSGHGKVLSHYIDDRFVAGEEGDWVTRGGELRVTESWHDDKRDEQFVRVYKLDRDDDLDATSWAAGIP